MLHFRHFTLDEANALRPWVRDRVRRLREAREALAESGPVAVLAWTTPVSGGSYAGPAYARAAVTYSLTVEELEDHDIIVRDLDRGLVDFPTLVDGEEGYLCWLVDEPEVDHWHGLGHGYAGRRRL